MNLHPAARNGSPGALAPASPSVRAGAAAQPRNLLSGLVPNFLESSMMQLAEDSFRKATREQLERVAAFAVGIDREKALGLSLLLAWSAAGARSEVPVPRNEFLSWIFTATPEELRALAARIVELSTPGAALLASGILEVMQEREQDAIRRSKL